MFGDHPFKAGFGHGVEEVQALVLNVLAESNAGQWWEDLLQDRLPLGQGQPTQIVAGQVQKVEDIVNQLAGRAMASEVLQRFEVRMALLIQDNDFAVEHGLMFQPLQGRDHGPVTLGEGQPVARVQPDFAMVGRR